MGTANTFNQGTGSLWWPDSNGGTAGSKPPTQQVNLAPDVWNRFEIEANGSEIVVRINNTEVQRADISTLPKSGSIRYRNGAIGFQSSSLALLSFRNIRLRTLNPGSTATDSSFNRAQP